MTADVAEAKPETKPSKSRADRKQVMVTYVPRHADDPSETTWNGHRFVANKPRPVFDDGKEHGMVALAKENPWFEVEGHEKKKPHEIAGAPKTPDEYRAHATAWFKKAKTAREFESRWEDEAELREKAGVGTDDIEWLNDIGGPILSDLKRRDRDAA